MSDLRVIHGNIFCSQAQTLVNTVNCVGVMGAGIAFEFRLRYPQMYTQYAQLCERGLLDVGKLWIYKAPERWVLNLPTKQHWRQPSEERFLHAGLSKFMQTYQARGIQSVAFPLLGAQLGGISPERSLAIMQSYLSDCTIPVEIYQYDASAGDDVYARFKQVFLQCSPDQLKASGLRSQAITALTQALEREEIVQMNQLLSCDGVGEKTLAAAFAFVQQAPVAAQPALF